MTTREKLEAEYTVKNGRIQNPGKFEGEPLYVPYFWEEALNGLADDDDGIYFFFNVTATDREIFPELKGIKTVTLHETGNGFVCAE